MHHMKVGVFITLEVERFRRLSFATRRAPYLHLILMAWYFIVIPILTINGINYFLHCGLWFSLGHHTEVYFLNSLGWVVFVYHELDWWLIMYKCCPKGLHLIATSKKSHFRMFRLVFTYNFEFLYVLIVVWFWSRLVIRLSTFVSSSRNWILYSCTSFLGHSSDSSFRSRAGKWPCSRGCLVNLLIIVPVLICWRLSGFQIALNTWWVVWNKPNILIWCLILLELYFYYARKFEP